MTVINQAPSNQITNFTLALPNAKHGQQPRFKQHLTLRVSYMRPHDHLHRARLVLDGHEDRALRRARLLSKRDQPTGRKPMMLPPYSRPRPIRNKAPGQPLRPAAA